MTTLEHILSKIRNALILPKAQVNYGWSSGLEPPYISVMNYRHEITYDTGGPATKTSNFSVVVIDKKIEQAEQLADQVDTLLNCSTTVTANANRCTQVGYEANQLEEKLYQFGVRLDYELFESLED